MKISSVHLNKVNTNFKSSELSSNKRAKSISDNSVKASSLEAMSTYNRAFINNEDLPEYDYDSLPDRKFSDELESGECRQTGDINFSSLDIAQSWDAQLIRQGLKGSEINNDINKYLEEYICAMNSTDYNPDVKINEEISDEEDSILKQIAASAITIRSISPTVKQHEIYRVVSYDPISPDSKEYIENLKALKPGETTMLSPVPVYVSSSAKKIMNNYAHQTGSDGVLFKILLPEGSHIMPASYGGVEQCLMEPCAQFKVLNNEKYKNNFNVITLEYILPDKNN